MHWWFAPLNDRSAGPGSGNRRCDLRRATLLLTNTGTCYSMTHRARQQGVLRVSVELPISSSALGTAARAASFTIESSRTARSCSCRSARSDITCDSVELIELCAACTSWLCSCESFSLWRRTQPPRRVSRTTGDVGYGGGDAHVQLIAVLVVDREGASATTLLLLLLDSLVAPLDTEPLGEDLAAAADLARRRLDLAQQVHRSRTSRATQTTRELDAKPALHAKPNGEVKKIYILYG